MLKSLFALTELRYPSVVKAGAAIIALSAMLGIAVNTTTPPVVWIVYLLTLLPICLASFIFAERYYVASVLALALVHISFITYISINAFILNSTPVFLATLADITLAALLLGGLGATITAIYTLFALAISELLMISGVLVAPPNSPAQTEIVYISGISINVIVILIVYTILVFFTNVVRRGLTEVERQRDELQTNNRVLLAIQHEGQRLSQQVSGLAQRVAASVEQQSAVANQQASQSQNLATALTELEHNIQLISDASENVGAAVKTATRDARSGKGATDRATAALERINATVVQMSLHIANLSEQARQVSLVLDLISDVADETQMLALNATIEASGAGPQGRRFNVIAQQVSALAQRTRDSVSDISRLVSTIEDAASEAMSISRYGMAQSKESASLTGAAGAAHQNILSSVDHTAALVQSITAASDQQRRASESAVVGVQQLSHTAQQSAQASTSLVEIAHELTSVASRLAERSAGIVQN